MKKTEPQQQDTKRQILDSAKMEFADKGYDGARMGAIARTAKVNQALLHYYFGNKENLYKEVLISHGLFGATLINRLEEVSGAFNLTASEKLYIGIYLLVNVHLEALDAELIKILSREMADQREHFKTLIRDYLIPRHEVLVGAILEGIKAGEFATKNPLLVVIGINTLILNYINSRNLLSGSTWYKRLYGEKHKEELLDFLIEHTFKGLRPEGRRLKIPAPPKELIEALNMVINDARQEQQMAN